MNTKVSNEIPYAYLYSATLASGRVAVPVSAAQLPYANFKHVAGTVVAGGSASAYALDKLKILDTLIDRLKSARGATRSHSSQNEMNTSDVDAQIQSYGEQLHKALVSDSLSYAKPVGVVPGMLVSVAA